MKENIRIVVRVRPEEKNDAVSITALNNNSIVQVQSGDLEAQTFRCNQVFRGETTQIEVFNNCGITNLLDSVLNGYRACCFAFGQTGSGKTYTVFGNSLPSLSGESMPFDGLMSRSLEYLFQRLEASKAKFLVRLTCVEIYQEQVYDLLAPPVNQSAESSDMERPVGIGVREHTTEGFFLEGCHVVPARSHASALSTVMRAVNARRSRGHNMNATSSRSHCLTDIFVDLPPGYPGNGRDYTVMGRMTLVDLAGSERLKQTHNTGEASAEAGFINKSLFVLGKVIAGLALAEGDASSRLVPFRDSKLTKLLIGSLGGKGRTLMVACVRDGKASVAETLRTLKFSMSCARIQSKPVRFLNVHEKLIADLRDEIERLRNENFALKSTLITRRGSASGSPASLMNGSRLDEADSRAAWADEGRLEGRSDHTPAPEQNDRIVKSIVSVSSIESEERIKQLEDRILRIEAQAMSEGEDASAEIPLQRESTVKRRLPKKTEHKGPIGARKSASSSRMPKKVSSADTVKRPGWDDGSLKPNAGKRAITPSPYISHIKFGYHPDIYTGGTVKPSSSVTSLSKPQGHDTVARVVPVSVRKKVSPGQSDGMDVVASLPRLVQHSVLKREIPVFKAKPSIKASPDVVKHRILDTVNPVAARKKSFAEFLEEEEKSKRKTGRRMIVEEARAIPVGDPTAQGREPHRHQLMSLKPLGAEEKSSIRFSHYDLEKQIQNSRQELLDNPEQASVEAYEAITQMEKELNEMRLASGLPSIKVSKFGGQPSKIPGATRKKSFSDFIAEGDPEASTLMEFEVCGSLPQPTSFPVESVPKTGKEKRKSFADIMEVKSKSVSTRDNPSVDPYDDDDFQDDDEVERYGSVEAHKEYVTSPALIVIESVPDTCKAQALDAQRSLEESLPSNRVRNIDVLSKSSREYTVDEVVTSSIKEQSTTTNSDSIGLSVSERRSASAEGFDTGQMLLRSEFEFPSRLESVELISPSRVSNLESPTVLKRLSKELEGNSSPALLDNDARDDAISRSEKGSRRASTAKSMRSMGSGEEDYADDFDEQNEDGYRDE